MVSDDPALSYWWDGIFVTISRDPSLTPTQHRVLSTILQHVRDEHRDITRQTVANEIGMSLATVKRAVGWLSANDYLLIEKQANARGFRAASAYRPGPKAQKSKGSSTSKGSPVTQQKQKLISLVLKSVDQVQGCANPDKEDNERSTPRLVRQVPEEVRDEHPHPLHPDVGLGAREVPGDSEQVTLYRPDRSRGAESGSIVPRTERAEQPMSVDRAIDRVLAQLTRVRRNGASHLASCPVTSHGKGNGDREPSLSIGESDGRVLLKCMSGCQTTDVLVAMNLDWPDLFDEPITNERGVKVDEWVYQSRDGSPYMVAERWQKPHGKRFVQRIPGADRAGLPAGFKPALFKLPKVLAAAQAGEEVFIVEGEKSVSAAEKLGVVATTAPGGAARLWEDYYAKWLEGASRVTVVCDNDEPGIRHAAEVVASLKMHKIPVRAMKVAVPDDKADLYDHVLAGFGIADLKPARLNRLHPKGTSLCGLLTGNYPAIKWVIPDLLPVGLTMLGGAPKVGKSMIALDIALAVAHGGYALYGPKVNQGSVLYLSLDNDDESTLSARARHLSARVGYPNDGPMEILTEYPVGRDAIAAISEWIEMERDEDRQPLFVVADTLARIEPEYEGSVNDRSLYAGATAAMARWSALADKAQIGIMFVHHSHKQGERGKGSDWMNLFMGSQGLAAGCKNLMMVQHERGTNDAYLLTDSRHCDGQELRMIRDGWGWSMFDQITTRPSVPGKAGMRVIAGGKS